MAKTTMSFTDVELHDIYTSLLYQAFFCDPVADSDFISRLHALAQRVDAEGFAGFLGERP